MNTDKQFFSLKKLESTNFFISGKYFKDTKDLKANQLIPFWERDIFLIRKEQDNFKGDIRFEITIEKPIPTVIVVIESEAKYKTLHLTKLQIIKILWNYNYIKYEAEKDQTSKRFDYRVIIKNKTTQLQSVA